MSTTTPNRGLIKPELTDAADITAFNSNWDIIDEELAKGAEITGAASTIVEDDLTKNRVVISDNNGKVAVSEVTSDELSYLKGLKSNLQNQLDNMDFNVTGAASTIIDDNLSPNRVVVTDANGKISVSTLSDTDVKNKVNKSGDNLTGSLTFNNYDSYHIVHKYRDINNVRYGVNIGCGVLGGQGVVTLESRQGDNTESPMLGRLEVGDLGVSYVDSEGKRTYLVRSEVASSVVE